MMMTLIFSAAVAAAQPADSPANPSSQHSMTMGEAQHADHTAKEECCCKDMAAKHEDHAEHRDHTGH